MKFDHGAKLITDALGVDVANLHETMMVYAKGMMECGTESKVAELFYRKAMNDEQFMRILVFLAMRGISDLVKSSVKELLESVSPEERKEMVREVMGVGK